MKGAACEQPYAKAKRHLGVLFLRYYFEDYYFGLKKYLIFAAQKLLWKPRIVRYRGEMRGFERVSREGVAGF